MSMHIGSQDKEQTGLLPRVRPMDGSHLVDQTLPGFYTAFVPMLAFTIFLEGRILLGNSLGYIVPYGLQFGSGGNGRKVAQGCPQGMFRGSIQKIGVHEHDITT